MSQSLIGALRVTLGLDSAEFTRGTKKAQAEMATFQGRMSAAGTAIAGAFGAIVGSEVFSYFSQSARAGLELASSLGEQSQQLGVNAEALQVYRYAATQVGLAQDEMDQALAQGTRRLGEAASGSGEAAKAYAALGIKIRDANGNVRSISDLMPEIADALAKIPTPAQRAAVLVDLFGKSGMKLAPLLASGGAAIRGFAEEARAAGLILSDELIAKADAGADALAKIQKQVEIQQAAMAAGNVESLLAYEQFLAQLQLLLQKGIGDVVRSIENIPDSKSWKLIKEIGKVGALLQFNTTAWTQVFADARQSVIAEVEAMGTRAGAAVRRMVESIRSWISNTLNAVWNGAISKIKEVVGWFDWMDNEVVRNSYVPDMVDGIAAQMKRLDAVLVKPTADATQSATKSFREMAQNARDLMANLFPEVDAVTQYKANEAMLRKSIKDEKLLVEALMRNWEMYNDQLKVADRTRLALSQEEGAALPDSAAAVEDQIDRLNRDLPGLRTTSKRTFEDMARGAQNTAATIANAMEDMRNSISGFINSIKKGDIIGIIGGLANVIGSVLDAFGKGGSLSGLGKAKPVPAYAGGTAFHPGGLALVGEKGAELVRLPRGSQVFPHGTGPAMGGAVQVVVTANDYFDAKVQQVSGGVVARTAPAIAQAGSQMAEGRIMARGRRRLA